MDAGMIGKVYRAWFPLGELPIDNMKPGDKITQTKGPESLLNGVTYQVKTVKLVDFGSQQYVECDLVQEDYNG